MKACPFCGYKNPEGAWFCDGCGINLYDVSADETLPTKEVPLATFQSSPLIDVGITQFPPGSTLIIYIRNANQPLILKPDKRLILGRFHTSNAQKPDIDLTPHGAVEQGVSRVHAALEPIEDHLTLTDLGSTNGTFLNSHPLTPYQPRLIRDGDEIHLGKLLFHIYFAHRAT